MRQSRCSSHRLTSVVTSGFASANETAASALGSPGGCRGDLRQGVSESLILEGDCVATGADQFFQRWREAREGDADSGVFVFLKRRRPAKNRSEDNDGC